MIPNRGQAIRLSLIGLMISGRSALCTVAGFLCSSNEKVKKHREIRDRRIEKTLQSISWLKQQQEVAARIAQIDNSRLVSLVSLICKLLGNIDQSLQLAWQNLQLLSFA